MTPFGHIDDDFEAEMSGETDADFLEPLQGEGENDEDLVEISSTLPDFDVTSEELQERHRRKTSTVLEMSDTHNPETDL
jgi:hypothetical protein